MISKKQIVSHEEASKKIQLGVNKLADTVKSTLGPGGTNVVLKRLYGPPLITKDGVTVAREITLEDPMEDVGAQLVKAVAVKTVDTVGDGTTTATVLAQAIYNAGLKNVTSGANPIDLKRGIDIAVKAIVEHLKSKSHTELTPEDIAKVAIVSTNNDAVLGPLVAEAVTKVGLHGIVTAEESKSPDDHVKYVEGMQFMRGFTSPYFINVADKQACEFDEPLIIVTDKKITAMQTILPALEEAAKTGKPIILVADEYEDEVLQTLVVNKMRGALKICAIKAPGAGDHKKPMLDDLIVVVGGKLVSDAYGLKMEKHRVPDMGTSKKVIIDKDKAVFIDGGGDKVNVQERIKALLKQKEDAITDFEKEILSNRIAKMDGGVAIINVGAASEVELKEKKDRVDDAIHATQAAMAEGILPGGGVAYLKAASILNDVKGASEDQNTGIKIVQQALYAPFATLVKNALGKDSDAFAQKVIEGEGYGYGWDARERDFKDLLTFGIVDPAKVARLALENAASVAGLLLTTRSVVFEIEPKPNVATQNNGALQ